MTRVPLLPMRSVLCPGVALPLHIFEDRDRLMVDRCLERGEDFGVVLLKSGHEVGRPSGTMATIGTMAAIRRAGRYPDGRFDILTVGQRRFRLEGVDTVSEPYLVADVRFLGEPVGPVDEARSGARHVGRRFLDYLELLQPESDASGPEIQIEFEIEVEAPDTEATTSASDDPPTGSELSERPPEADLVDGIVRSDGSLSLEGSDPLIAEMDAADLSPAQRRELLMAAARRLTATDDPTALSYVLTALIQVDLGARQRLLEAADTVARLRELDRLLARESWFLRQGLRPIIIEAIARRPRSG